MNERIKTLRKSLCISQKEFGRSIGLSQRAISLMESGKCNVTDRNIQSICSAYAVSEPWLRTGEGDMLLPRSREEEIAAFVKGALRGGADSFRGRLLLALSRLDDAAWERMEKFAAALPGENP